MHARATDQQEDSEKCKTATNSLIIIAIVYTCTCNKLLGFRSKKSSFRSASVSSKICVLRLQLHLLLQAPVFRVHNKVKKLVLSAIIDT